MFFELLHTSRRDIVDPKLAGRSPTLFDRILEQDNAGVRVDSPGRCHFPWRKLGRLAQSRFSVRRGPIENPPYQVFPNCRWAASGVVKLEINPPLEKTGSQGSPVFIDSQTPAGISPGVSGP